VAREARRDTMKKIEQQWRLGFEGGEGAANREEENKMFLFPFLFFLLTYPLIPLISKCLNCPSAFKELKLFFLIDKNLPSITKSSFITQLEWNFLINTIIIN
jgi:hypothetical protein